VYFVAARRNRFFDDWRQMFGQSSTITLRKSDRNRHQNLGFHDAPTSFLARIEDILAQAFRQPKLARDIGKRSTDY